MTLYSDVYDMPYKLDLGETMYESFYGLKEKPFNLTPDPAYFYLSQTHKSAYSYLLYAVMENKGFVVITGEIGAGKTTLIKYLLKQVGTEITIGVINNTHLFPRQMLKLICREFELKVSEFDPIDLQEIFYAFLQNEHAKKKRVVLIIDEAQNLPPDNLEELRILSNLESDKNHLLQVILIGQPGLKDNLKENGLEQFTQRITVSCHLGRLSANEARDYIHFRLKSAGANNMDIFSPEDIEVIHKYSEGIPRVIDIICDAALLYGYAGRQRSIGEKLIQAIINDRKRSGIYDASEKMLGKKGPSRVPVGKISSVEIESEIALIEKRLQIIEDIEGHLMMMEQTFADQFEKIDKDLEMVARQDVLAVEMMKILKESIKRRMIMANTYGHAENFKEEKNVKRGRSFFGKK